jgi:hypothetical protein
LKLKRWLDFGESMKRPFETLLLIAVASVIVAVGGLWGLYAYGLNALPSDTSPDREPVPLVALQALWVSVTETTSMVMEPLSPWNWVRAFTIEGQKAFPPSARVASYAARFLLARNHDLLPGFSSQIKRSSASIWVSRNWKAEEALATILNESYFGHGFRGIKQAVRGYFGLPVEALSVSEAALLAGLIRSPIANDPWCYPQHSNALAEALMVKQNLTTRLSPRLLPAPAGACKDNETKSNKGIRPDT